ncbi:hypothetical protein [Enterococcus gallinarum]|nr:hypothetical protein [Enterococcus gallinarum]MCR1929422.1 hypothetical protein [Enterococcus gallinarum]MCR1932286.1 hypothetical protein [Enterococcus gallinarum]
MAEQLTYYEKNMSVDGIATARGTDLYILLQSETSQSIKQKPQI